MVWWWGPHTQRLPFYLALLLRISLMCVLEAHLPPQVGLGPPGYIVVPLIRRAVRGRGP